MAAKKAAEAAAQPVTTMVNGQVVGSIPGEGTIVDAAKQLASSQGLKAFSIRINGATVKAPDASKPLKGVKTLEIFAKDTRG